MPPRGNAPGLKVGRNSLKYWIARQVVRDPMGFPDKCIPLPRNADKGTLSRLCLEHSARLFAWIDEQKKVPKSDTKTRYDGSVMSACRIYQEHPYSDFHGAKFNTRATYTSTLKLIETTVGRRLIRNLTVLDVKHWYKEWRKPAQSDGKERIKRAHEGVTMFRTVLRFCAALFGRQHPELKHLAEELKLVKFEKAGTREQELTYAHTRAFVTKALELGEKGVIPADRARYMAIGVAAQFDLMVRQKDIIGEWSPRLANRKPPAGVSMIEHNGKIWTGYFTWESIPGWRWRMKTSKSKYRSPAEFDLTRYSLLFPLLEMVPHDQRTGPIVKGEHGLPVRQTSYGKWFRQIARAAGIPDDVWSMDARAGGATEAEEAGADVEAIQSALTHSKKDMTLRYIRRRSSKIAAVAEARTNKRAQNEGGTS
jgi:hypothetical protein